MTLCVGGPKHGIDIRCKCPGFFAPVRLSKPRMICDTVPAMEPPIEKVRYERRIVFSDGKPVDIFIVP